MDAVAQQAREAHRRLAALDAERDQVRQRRNTLIRRLRDDDPERWTYGALARLVDCKPELIAAIIQGRTT